MPAVISAGIDVTEEQTLETLIPDIQTGLSRQRSFFCIYDWRLR